MKTVNPTGLEKLRELKDNLVRRLSLILGGTVISIMVMLFFVGGTLYAILTGFAAAAGLVHLFEGPDALAYVLGAIFALLIIQSRAGLLFLLAAFFGAVYAWGWSWLIALIVFLPGLAVIPLAFLAAAAVGLKGALSRR